MSWNDLQLTDQSVYARQLAAMPEPTADYTFTNLWAWSSARGLRWRTAHGLCWLRQERNSAGVLDTPAYWAPVGDWYAADWNAMPELVPGTTLLRVPERLCMLLHQHIPDRIVIEESPNEWEYHYACADLAALSGRILHKKRNHVNAYLKNFREDYRPLTEELIPDALALEKAWLAAYPDASASQQAESAVCCKVLQHWEQLTGAAGRERGSPNGGLHGGALYAEGQMVAFCVAEALTPDMEVVHFEKALPSVRGAFQVINWCFARSVAHRCARINREQDSGDPGLRMAKRSYQPFEQIRKHSVRIVA